MWTDRVEPKWVDVFVEMLGLTGVQPGEVVAIASETQSRPVLVQLTELALARIGARYYHVVAPSPLAAGRAPLRSTGACLALGGLQQIIDALASASLIIDCTVEGLLHSPERKDLLARGARIFMISNEQPEVFERLRPAPGLQALCERGGEMITQASSMHITSAAGTDLRVNLQGVPGRGTAGVVTQPGRGSYWPSGLCICNPPPGSVNGKVVLAPGDANLTFKRYLEAAVTLVIENDFVTSIQGDGLDAELLRSYYAAWGDRDAYATAHVGWGMNPGARWDTLVMYDRNDINGTELRAFAGNFLFSTGANEAAGRFSEGHLDIPMRNCSIRLDDRLVVDKGVLCDELTL